jgi:malate synthase
MVSVLGAMHDLKSKKNSKQGSIYIVKPKMHGPEEVAATSELFGRVEDALGLERNTIKLGIMDEEQRTSVNLGECERAAKDRVVFINTGFLDRTGDLLHTAMKAGPMETKANIQGGSWLDAYERSNVITGLRTGLQRVGQIGKGMWARSTDKAGLLEQKHNHPEAGANTAWVPNPMAAVLHAIHYHTRDVDAIQAELSNDLAPVEKAEILNLPLLTREMGDEERLERLDEYAQSLLGYVVHWVDNGVGCSAIPNFEDVKLMEDLATLRIGSQLLANWLEHGVITQDEVIASFGKMAKRVDGQSTKVPNYNNMAGNYDGPAFQTALDLVFHGTEAENGYTETRLREARRDVKRNGPQRGGGDPRWRSKVRT